MPDAAMAAVQSQIKTAPTPKAARPMMTLVAASPTMNGKYRSPAPNATQLPIAPKQAKTVSEIRYCTARIQRGVSGDNSPIALAWPCVWMTIAMLARKNTRPAQSGNSSGPCRLEGPLGIGTEPGNLHYLTLRD